MASKCTHTDSIADVDPSTTEGCEDCLRTGGRWVHLRLCLSCGVVACCDDSPRQHASAHFTETRHPLIDSLEPGDHWRWCYVDQTLVVGGAAPAPEQRTT